MKNAYQIESFLDERYRSILNFDKIEIDNPDSHHYRRLNYADRLRLIVSLAEKEFPPSSPTKVGDFACAQSNIGITLAELGYKVYGFDVNPAFIEYSKMKYEKGDIEWFCSNIDTLEFPKESLDLAIAGELIEHCAYPEDIVQQILSYVRPGGVLIVTTPNGSRLKTNLPTFRQVSRREQRKIFEERQFGPAGEDHLFLFRINEVHDILPPNAKIIEVGYVGGTLLVNQYSYPWLRVFSVRTMETIIRFAASLPVLNSKTFHNIYAVIQKLS